MATLKELLADKTTSSTIDFRNNDKVSDDGVLWSFAWVENKEGKLLCIGATLETLQKISANPEINTLMLTIPEEKVHSSNGIKYDLCQLLIDNNIKTTFDISYSKTSLKTNKNINNINQKMIKSLLIGFIIAIIIGYLFSTELYFKKGYEVSNQSDYTITKEYFNFKIGALTFAFVSGFVFFIYYDENKKYFILKNLNSIRNKYRFKYDLQKLKKAIKHPKEDITFLFRHVIFNFSGRVSRGNFLGELLALNLISYFFFEAIKNETSLFFKMIFLIAYLFFILKINIRRLHDFNYSGWYSIISLIPLGIYLLGLLTKWGFLMSIVISGWNVLFGITIIYNLILLIMPGNKFTNTYGEEK
jgi:uncharacterized membrane protein YhaH (DUF805 family)